MGKGTVFVPAVLRPIAPAQFCQAGSAYGRRATHDAIPINVIDPEGVEPFGPSGAERVFDTP